MRKLTKARTAVAAAGVACVVVVVLIASPLIDLGWANTAFDVAAIAGIGIALVLTIDRLEQANEELRRSAVNLQAGWDLWDLVSRISRVGAWSYDVATGRIEQSDEVRRIYGFGPGESVDDAESAFAVYPPAYRARVEEAFRACMTEGVPFDEELEIERPDGTRVPVRANAAAVLDDAGRVVKVQGGLRDLTPLRTEELAQRRSLLRLRMLIDVVPAKVWISSPDARPEMVSSRLVEYSGLSADELMQVGAVVGLVHPEDLDTRLPAMREAMRRGEEHHAELRLRRHDGVYRWHLVRSAPLRDDDGEVEQWFTAATDVHHIRELEAESERLAEELATTLQGMSDGFMLLDEDYRVTYRNPAAVRMGGQASGPVEGLIVWDALPEIRGTVVEDSYRRTMESGETTHFRFRDDRFDMTTEIAVYRTGNGLAVYIHDITRPVALEERLRRAERLESIGQLTGGVAHDFNNLLTVVMAGTGLLREELGPEHPSLETVALVESAAARGAELTRRLLAFARRQPLEPRPVDLGALVDEVTELLSRTLGESVEVVTTVEHGLPPALVDPGQLENALINVCINGRDAMPGGGLLRVAVGLADVAPADAERMEVEPGAYLLVSVTDTGVGIEPEVVPHLFEPFFTTKTDGTGTGLGLPMVYGLLKQSGGHVAVDSRPGEGTTVSMYVPVADSPAPAAAEPAPSAPPATGQSTRRTSDGETVLVVEDDAAIRRFTEEQLSRLGYAVVAVADGPTAIDVLRGDRHLDLLLTDVVLPGGVSGRDVAEVAAQARPGLPVLFTSGYTADTMIRGGRLEVGVDLLPKPYPAEQLAARVRRALDRG